MNNLVFALSSLARKIKAGNKVYIRFFGHGSRAPQGSGADLLLLLFDTSFDILEMPVLLIGT